MILRNGPSLIIFCGISSLEAFLDNYSFFKEKKAYALFILI
jgi:hypothetical protein